MMNDKHSLERFRTRPRFRVGLAGVICLALIAGGCDYVEGLWSSVFGKKEQTTEASNVVKGKLSPEKKAEAPAKPASAPTAPAPVAPPQDPQTKAEPAPAAAKKLTKEEEAEQARLNLMERIKAAQAARTASFVFNPTGLTDPFLPFMAELDKRKEAEEGPEAPTKTPLQKMALSQIKLVAVILSPGNDKALVEDSAGLGYIIEVGTPIGLNKGAVARILPEEVEIQEEFKNYMGQTKERTTVLKLYPGKGEKK